MKPHMPGLGDDIETTAFSTTPTTHGEQWPTTVHFTATGANIGELIEQAQQTVSRYAGTKSTRIDITKLSSQPLVEQLGEGIQIWQADIEATVWV